VTCAEPSHLMRGDGMAKKELSPAEVLANKAKELERVR
jgi:hypothetical protein